MAAGITIHVDGDKTCEFPDTDGVERIVDTLSRWGLTVGSLAVLRGRELKKAFKSTEWRWYERQVDVEPQPPKYLMVPRRDGRSLASREIGGSWSRASRTAGDRITPWWSTGTKTSARCSGTWK